MTSLKRVYKYTKKSGVRLEVVLFIQSECLTNFADVVVIESFPDERTITKFGLLIDKQVLHISEVINDK